ncbi:MAG: hypothetical protein ACYSR6_07160 [Planctomycetota bacterium]
MALEHYAQVAEADLQEAAKMSLLGDAEQAAQNPAHEAQKTAQHPAASDSTEPQVTEDRDTEMAILPSDAVLCGAVQGSQMPGTGVEPARPEGH